MEVSIFKGWTDESPATTTLEALVEMMRTDASLKDLTDKHRYYCSIDDKSAAKHYKRRMPCFSVAVRFEGGKRKEHIAAWTGLTLVDIDHVAPDDMARVLALVKHDPHTLLAYTTISGQGVRVIVAVDYVSRAATKGGVATTKSTLCAHHNEDGNHSPLTTNPRFAHESLYKNAFLQANAYYARLTGLATDPLCKNATRLSGAAYDADLSYNPDATPLVVEIPESRKVGRPRKTRSATDMEQLVLREVEQQGIRYQPGQHNSYISRAGYLMNRYGVPCEECAEWATKRFADYAEQGNDVAGIIRSCYQQTAEHGTQKPTPEKKDSWATIKEIQDYLIANDIRVRHNVISRKLEILVVDENTRSVYEDENPSPLNVNRSPLNVNRWVELTDRHVNSIYRAFSLDTGRRLRIQDLYIIIESNFYPEYHPLHSYLQSLPPWDGRDYIGELASTVHVREGEQELHNRFFKKWFVAMVAAWLESDKTNHEILTYIGAQGIYKSTFMRMLLPPALRDYFSARNFAHRMNRDDKLELSEMALVALEELDNLKPQELNQLKAVTTDPSVNERAAYARYRERRDHIASFCGTGNNPHFLTDLTGNRRWLPFLVDSIDSPFDHPFNYTGLYSQAYTLWRSGFPYWFDAAENDELALHNRQFEEPCMEEELIMTYLRKPYENEAGEFLTATRIIELIGQYVRTKLQPRHISMAMKRLGFEQRRTKSARGWLVVILTGDDIKNNQRQAAHQSWPDA